MKASSHLSTKACLVTCGFEMSTSSSSMEVTLNDLRESMEYGASPTEECFLPGVSGEPKTYPRVGEQYQAVIPDVVEENECSKPDAEKVNKVVDYLLPALPIPLMWAPNKARDAETCRALHGQADPYAEENQVVINGNSENVSVLTAEADNVDNKLKVDKMKLDAASREGSEMILTKKEKNLYPLPGTPDEPWSDFELDAFLLALYIFGKDLYLVKKFVETKKMNCVISFYYGPFYKCSKYQRWAKCLRSRSRKSIHGQRMFTGGRHQELFSRLNRHISDETSNKLAEASKTFKEDGMSFEDYVFTLKDLVGTKLLIEVVAVGKGKQDLTGIVAEPLKLNRSVSVRQETHQDKDLSSLSCKEIIEQLTSSRLSKTKSNDLFWEAVWPRLLAAGWHSEQPKDQHQLIFLMPGVNKFRRKRHVKGQHYFDSVSDVLNIVASDPQILELEDEKGKISEREEKHWEEQDVVLPNRKQNGYLNMSNSDKRRNEMDIMVVDTSKCRQGSKVKLMQTLPVHSAEIPCSSSACSGRDSSSEKSDGEVEETQHTKSLKYGVDIKKMSSKKHSLGSSRYLSPLKRHQANAVGLEDSSEVAEKRNDKPVILSLPNHYKVKENKQCQKGLDTEMSPLNSSHLVSFCSHSSPPNLLSKVTEGSAYTASENFNEIERHREQPLHQVLIDLNISQLPDDVETNHESRCSSSIAGNTSPVGTNKGTCQSHTSATHETPQQVQQVRGSNIAQQQRAITPLEEQQPNISGRRQSTRNRPLTTKALEAIESSFIESKSKRKATDRLTSKRAISVSNSNETTTGTITEYETPSKKARIALLAPHN